MLEIASPPIFLKYFLRRSGDIGCLFSLQPNWEKCSICYQFGYRKVRQSGILSICTLCWRTKSPRIPSPQSSTNIFFLYYTDSYFDSCLYHHSVAAYFGHPYNVVFLAYVHNHILLCYSMPFEKAREIEK